MHNQRGKCVPHMYQYNTLKTLLDRDMLCKTFKRYIVYSFPFDAIALIPYGIKLQPENQPPGGALTCINKK